MSGASHKPFSETYLGQLRQVIGTRLVQVPGARVVLEDEQGRVLLMKRRDFGIWGMPGGHPELGETIAECMVREVFEETGLELLSYGVFGVSSSAELEGVTYPNGDRIHGYVQLFYSREWRGKLHLENDEASELRFFAVDQLPETLKNEVDSLRRYLEFKRSGEFQLG